MFTDIFVQLLQEKGITPYRIAKETGISQGLMNEYKSGKKSPNIQNLIKIADYLDCSTDYLLGRTDSLNAKNETVYQDEMIEELVKAFNLLNFSDKIEIMNTIIEKTKK